MAGLSRYDKEHIADKLDSIRGWAKNGAADKDIAAQLGISRSTLCDWKNRYSEFAEALKVGKQQATGEILNAAFLQAVGFERDVTEPVKVKRQLYDRQSEKILTEEHVEMVTYTKYFPPVPLMTRFMLINKLPNEYSAAPDTDDASAGIVITHSVPRGEHETPTKAD